MSKVLTVGKVYEDGRYPSQPYAVRIRVGALVRVERFPSREAAKRGRKQAQADIALLYGAMKRSGKRKGGKR